MILIVSSAERERALLTAVCDLRGWPSLPCASMGEFPHNFERATPRVILVRHRLQDGFSDDIFVFLRSRPSTPCPKVIVLMAADTPAATEARQVTIGADCVLRDPLRVDVLLAYLSKFRLQGGQAAAEVRQAASFAFAGAEVYPHEHRAARNNRSVHLSPQETNLLRLLARSHGRVIPYPTLYAELFGRRFSGETSNCRVLLGKTAGTFKRLGIDLRAHVKVIAKSGYLPVTVEESAAPAGGPVTPRKQRGKAAG